MKAPLAKLLTYGAGGVGLAGLENSMVGENLPPELKKVNYGIGATTGMMLASPNEATRAMALAGVPLKEMALFGVGAADRFRRQQQSLTDTNLETAGINRDTARINRTQSAGKLGLGAAFLIPALLGGGGLAYLAHLNAKKHKAQDLKQQILAERGPKSVKRKVRIDVPASAFPEDFWSGMMTGENSPNTRTQLISKGSSAAEIVKYAATNGFSVPGMIGNLLWESSGVPSLQRAGQESGRGFDSLEQGQYHNLGRYGLSAAANAALGLVALRLGAAPVAAKLLGPGRLASWATRGSWALPGIAKPMGRFLFRHGLGNNPEALAGLSTLRNAAGKLVDEGGLRRAVGLPPSGTLNDLIDSSHAYDPKRFAWHDPSPAGITRPVTGTLNTLLREPKDIGWWQKDKLRSGVLAGRYGANRAVDLGYRAKQFLARSPNMAITLAATPFAGMGVLKDKYNDAMERQENQRWMPRTNENKGFYGMPVSSMAAGLMGSMGGPNVNQSFTNQLQ